MDYLTFINKSSNNASFRVDIVLLSDNVNDNDERGSVAYEVISHSFDSSYAQFSTYQHKAYCECGDYILEDHTSDNELIINGCTLCGEPHGHTYSDHYTWLDGTSHTAYCVCGTSHIEPHVIARDSSIFALKPFKTCMLCGGLATEGDIIAGINLLPHTENGSYISSNGVIVLADEDIEAFMNGELEFIYPDDGSEVS